MSASNDQLRTAIAFAHTFITEATNALNGLEDRAGGAAAHLRVSLAPIASAINDDCECGHEAFWHLGERNKCLHAACECQRFSGD